VDIVPIEPLRAPPNGLVARSHKVRRLWVNAAVAALSAALIGLAVLVTAGGDSAPPPAPRLEPVPAGDTAEEQARNLAAWLRTNGR
jgi:hypothetical protein